MNSDIDIMVQIVVEGLIFSVVSQEELGNNDDLFECASSVVSQEELGNNDDLLECASRSGTDTSNSKMCLGYTPKIDHFFQKFPFQRLPELDMVVVDASLHRAACRDNGFLLVNDSTMGINKSCFDVQFMQSMKKIEEWAGVEDISSTKLNNKYCNHVQLVGKVNTLNKNLSLLTISNYQQSKRIARLTKTLSFHKRFLVYIATNDISRLHELVNVALKNNHGIAYILEKCKSAVAGVYQARSGQDDKDLAFLVLKFGGPTLLDILHRAKLLPSTSTAYRMNKTCQPIQSSVHMSIKECFDTNFRDDWIGDTETHPDRPDADAMTLTIKMDETYIDPKIRYDPRCNEPVGICYQHHKEIPREFTAYDDAKLLQDKLASGSVHVPKECLIAGINSVVSRKPFNVIVAWPSCSKQDFEGSVKLYDHISKSIKSKTGFAPLSYNTDGDSLRRQVLHALMSHVVSPTSELGILMRLLPLMDLLVGEDDETANYDGKHLAKRLWTSIITNLKINGVPINKADLKVILELSTCIDARDVLSIICPKDKQNVPMATSCLLRMVDVVSEKIGEIPYKLYSIRHHLRLLANVYEGILALYAYVHLSLSQQVRMVSRASYSLLTLYRCENTTIVSSQLYHDLQSTFIDTACCVAKTQIRCPEQPMYTIRNGTDPAERYFGDARLLYKHNQLDALEVVYCSNAISKCSDILTRHPEWAKKGRASRRLALDYSNIHDWTGDMVAGHVDIEKEWKLGLNEANHTALEIGCEIDIEALEAAGVSLQKPNGDLVGVTSRDIDWSMIDDANEVDEVQPVSNESTTDDASLPPLVEMITPPASGNDIMVDVDGTMVYKATILKNLTENNPLSRDRLRRVQGITRHHGSAADADVNLDDILCLGDPVVMIAAQVPHVANIIELNSGENKVQFIKADEKDDTHITLTVKILQLVTVDDELYWNGLFDGNQIKIKGANCLSMQPELSSNPPANMSPYSFNKQLFHDMGAHLLLLPNNDHGQPSNSSNNTDTDDKRRCKVCRKSIPLSQMRKHVGFHLVSDHIKEQREHICGFCGRAGCKSSIKESSRKGKKKYYAPVSDCVYFFPYSNVPDLPTKKHPCTNVITSCPVCNMYNWKHNLTAHYEINHTDEEVPVSYCDKEKLMLSKLDFNK